VSLGDIIFMGQLGRTCRTASIWISFEGAIDVHFVYDTVCTMHGDRMVVPYNLEIAILWGLDNVQCGNCEA